MDFIFMIGVRGCGKSTLGLMASFLFKCRYVDAEQCVANYTGVSDSIYLQNHTIEEYQQLELALVKGLIAQARQQQQQQRAAGEVSPDPRQRFTIFVLPAVMIENAQLVAYFERESFPYVITIEREEAKILDYLDYNDSYDTGAKILRRKFAKYRRLSTFSYFNMFTTSSFVEYCSITSRLEQLSFGPIVLKATEKDFNVFISSILGPSVTPPVVRTAHLLDLRNKWSTALQFDYPSVHLQDTLYNLSDVIAGCDVLEICIDLIGLVELGHQDIETYLSRFVATLRRFSFGERAVLSIKNSLEELDAFLASYYPTIGIPYVSPVDLAMFYLDFLSTARRLGLSFVVLDLELCFPHTHKAYPPSETSLKRAHVSSSSSSSSSDSTAGSTGHDNSPISRATSAGRDSLVPRAKATMTDTKHNIILTDDHASDVLALVRDFLDKTGHTTVIGKYHCTDDPHFWDSPHGGLRIMKFADKHGITMVRLTSRAVSVVDNLSCTNFCRSARKEYPDILVTAFNVGELGKLSKLLNRVLTPVHFDLNQFDAASKSPHAMSPADRLQFRDLQKSLYRAFLVPSFQFLVVGNSGERHIEPAVHNRVFWKLGLPHKCLRVQPESTQQLVELVRAANFGGCTFTPPLATTTFGFADVVSPAARSIGAVDTLTTERSWKDPTHTLSVGAHNIDWVVFSLLARSTESPVNYSNRYRTALVLGAGGRSRSAIYALITLGYDKIMVHHPDFALAMACADHFNHQSPLTCASGELKHFVVYAVADHHVASATLPQGFPYPTAIVNADIILVEGKPILVELPPMWFSSTSGGSYIDTCIDPLTTPGLSLATRMIPHGWVVANGLNYAVTALAVQFEFFVRKPAPRPFIKKMFLESYLSSRPHVGPLDLH
ncbi:hypothetical protein ABC855_g368 [[Candida] zeylanoides]